MEASGFREHFERIVFTFVTQKVLSSSEVLGPSTIEGSVVLTHNYHVVIAQNFWQFQIPASTRVLKKIKTTRS